MINAILCWIFRHDPIIDRRADGSHCWRCTRCMRVTPLWCEVEIPK